MNETRIDVVKLILDQMIIKKRLVRDSIYFAPYIMSLIKAKNGFNGLCDVKHEIYRPFYKAKVFLNKPLTPYGQDAEAQNVDENVDEHASDDDNANVDNLGALLGNSGKPVTLETSSLTEFSKHVFQELGIRDSRKSGTCGVSNSRMCRVRES
jgi:hypothetical protein